MLPSIMAQPPYVVIPIEPTFRITDWNGRAIDAAQSRGNVVAVADFSGNLMRLESALWPTAAVLQKLCRNARHEEAFDGQARQLLTGRLGLFRSAIIAQRRRNNLESLRYTQYGLSG